jgi:beta-glucosidase
MREVEELSDAVLYAWYPGERGGDAVADIIFGNVSPSAKLPITFPKSIDQLPAFDDYSMKGRTYKYMTQAPLYPFGYGLSYAKMTWGNAKVSTAKIKKEQSIDVSIDVKNIGSINADEVVQLYLTIDNVKEELPIASLVNFKRVTINKGESTNVSFSVPYNEFSYINSKGEKIQHKGKATLTIANAAPGVRSQELGMNAVKFDVVVK